MGESHDDPCSRTEVLCVYHGMECQPTQLGGEEKSGEKIQRQKPERRKVPAEKHF